LALGSIDSLQRLTSVQRRFTMILKGSSVAFWLKISEDKAIRQAGRYHPGLAT